jgi:hypothetical protein
MKYAWDWMNNIKWVLEENRVMKMREAFMVKYISELEGRLAIYEAIRKERMGGTLGETVKVVDETLK